MTAIPGFNFAQLIDEAAQAIEDETNGSVKVATGARRVLLDRVKANLQAVTAQIDSGLTADTFRNAARDQLRTAVDVEVGGKFSQATSVTIGRDAVERSMQLQCHWIPWC